MKLNKRVLLMGLSLSVLSTMSFAEQASNAQAVFNDAYQNYLNAVKTKENMQQAAEQAYTLGKAIYGDNSDNTANLAINYAKSINGYGKKWIEKRFSLYQQAYTISVNNHGNKSLETVDSLVGMANFAPSAQKADYYLDQVIAIANTENKPKFLADMKLEAATILANKFSYEKYREAKNYLEEADEYYQANLPKNSVEQIKADFLMASFAEGRK